jgi:hypothetical protein
MAALLILNLARVRMTKAKKTYSTRQAAAKMRVSFRTLTGSRMGRSNRRKLSRCQTDGHSGSGVMPTVPKAAT